jgi:hypothetical protein
VSRRADHEHRLWALLMLELWRERWQPSACGAAQPMVNVGPRLDKAPRPEP